MPTPAKILEQMDAILDRLIKTAEIMKKLSSQVVSEAELAPLQKAQEGLVLQLTKLDASFQKVYKKMGYTQVSPLRKTIEEKLKKFQELNKGFIENLKSGQKLIEVEAPDSENKKNQ